MLIKKIYWLSVCLFLLPVCELGDVAPQLAATPGVTLTALAEATPTVTAPSPLATTTPTPPATSTPGVTPSPAVSPFPADTSTPTPQPSPIATLPPPTATPTSTPAPATPVPVEVWLDLANFYRALAGVPPAEVDPALSAYCEQHARYMAENELLTHEQDPDLPWASAEGALCAQSGNVWLGSGRAWQSTDAIEAWMGSVGHRLWLLHPTAQTFGYGFYRSGLTAAAALDVLSGADLAADPDYPDWPVRYPVPGQSDIPATDYPITLSWPYFGPVPRLDSTRLTTEAGVEIPHLANIALPANHKGIQLIPEIELAPDTTYEVTVTGNYDGEPFDYSWSFSTGARPALGSR